MRIVAWLANRVMLCPVTLRVARFVVAVAGASAWSFYAFACSSFSSNGVGEEGSDATSDRSAAVPPGAIDGGCRDFSLTEPFSSDQALVSWSKALRNGAIATASSPGDASPPTSPPAALYANGTIPDAGDRAVRASVTTTVPFLPSTMQVRYALQVPSSSAYGQVGCAIHFGQGPLSPTFDVFVAKGSLETRGSPGDGGVRPTHVLTAQPVSDWILVEMTTTGIKGADAVGAVVRATTRGGALLRNVIVEPIPAAAATTGVEIECGIGYADLGGTATSGPDRVEVLVDDLSVTACRE